MKRNEFNYVNFQTKKGRKKREGNKTRDGIVMTVGGFVIFILTFFIYGIVDDSGGVVQKEIKTDNMDILAQIDQLEEQKKKKEEKLSMIKNDVFLGKNTAVNEYAESLINDLKALAERNESVSFQSEKQGSDSSSSILENGEDLNNILSYLQEDDVDSVDIFNTNKNEKVALNDIPDNSIGENRVRSLFAFSNTQRSARIYNNGFNDVYPENPDRPGDLNRIQNHGSDNPDKMKLVFNANPLFTIFEGEFITASITNRVVNDKQVSPVTAIVTEDLLDGRGRFVLIPANSRITGNARKVSGQQDTRIFIDFHRMIFPNGKSLNLGGGENRMSALDYSGALGIRGKKNTHFFTKFGSSILYGSLNGLSGFAQNSLNQSSGLSRFIDRTSHNFNTLNDRIASDSLAILPTITIKAGTQIKIRFSSDVIISAYARVSERTYY